MSQSPSETTVRCFEFYLPPYPTLTPWVICMLLAPIPNPDTRRWQSPCPNPDIRRTIPQPIPTKQVFACPSRLAQVACPSQPVFTPASTWLTFSCFYALSHAHPHTLGLNLATQTYQMIQLGPTHPRSPTFYPAPHFAPQMLHTVVLVGRHTCGLLEGDAVVTVPTCL